MVGQRARVVKGIRRLNKTIEVFRPLQVVPIDFRFPGDVSACFGLQATVVGRFPVDRPVIPAFGEYSLEFEGKKIHPVNFIVPWVSQEAFSDATQHRLGILPLAVQVGTSRMITGFYHDLDRQRLDAPPRRGISLACSRSSQYFMMGSSTARRSGELSELKAQNCLS